MLQITYYFSAPRGGNPGCRCYEQRLHTTHSTFGQWGGFASARKIHQVRKILWGRETKGGICLTQENLTSKRNKIGEGGRGEEII